MIWLLIALLALQVGTFCLIWSIWSYQKSAKWRPMLEQSLNHRLGGHFTELVKADSEHLAALDRLEQALKDELGGS